jgi:ribosomal protein S20
MIRPRLALAAAAVLIAASTGCGAATPAGELDPTLRTQLTQVDQALAAGDYPQARDDLDTLAEQTATARDKGRISAEQADRILTAITRVTANLPEPTAPTPARPPALPSESARNTGERPDIPQATDTSPGNDTQGGGEQQGNGEENGKSEEKGESENKGKSEEKGKETERGGGENSGGPDDGRGN